jgi:hypothetical protein
MPTFRRKINVANVGAKNTKLKVKGLYWVRGRKEGQKEGTQDNA